MRWAAGEGMAVKSISAPLGRCPRPSIKESRQFRYLLCGQLFGFSSAESTVIFANGGPFLKICRIRNKFNIRRGAGGVFIRCNRATRDAIAKCFRSLTVVRSVARLRHL